MAAASAAGLGMTSAWTILRTAPLLPSGVSSSRRRRRTRLRASARRQPTVASITLFDARDFVVERTLGTVGYMSVSSYAPGTSREDDDDDDNPSGSLGSFGSLGVDTRGLGNLGRQELQAGGVQAKLYTGRVVRGPRSNARVLLKAYPSRKESLDADAMAANELAAHAALQPPVIPEDKMSQHLCFLLGGFQTSAGEQWLVFRNEGTVTAAEYAAAASEAGARGVAVGQGDFFDRWDRQRMLRRRRRFVLKLLAQVFQGLAFMHANGFLHQSLGPASVVLSTTQEMDVATLTARLKDLAFSVDVRETALFGGPTLGELWDRSTAAASQPIEAGPGNSLAEDLWRRAALAGAKAGFARRTFGVADDMYAAGLLVAYMCFVPFCQPGSIDGPSTQRLLESTFRLDVAAARDYCAADDRWADAVEFLDAGNQAGWDLLQAMLNKDYKARPTAESCTNHPFFSAGWQL
eukprot:jgi/Chlat1/3944/Chrsp26S04197